MISVAATLPDRTLVLVLQDPSPQGGGEQAPPVLRRGDGPPAGGGEGQVEDPQQTPKGAPPGCFDMQTLPLLLGFVAIFYFLILRPQQKAEKQRKALLASIKKGERVVSNSGIHGEITALTDETVTLRVDKDVHLTFDRAAIGRVLNREQPDAGGSKR